MEMLQNLAVIISFTSIFPVCLLAQNSPQDYLKIHNDARAAVGVKPLLWDLGLESYAFMFVRKHIEHCLEGEDIHPTGFSQNIAHTRTSEYLVTGADAVASWVATMTTKQILALLVTLKIVITTLLWFPKNLLI
ncbi:hypothetical protein PIB30_077401 [Stylosanthes scabra]|uniref:SCP domain-containing protein n=1 Tax=Stylosanthes scabra TaxID=79078 RepID=A0ABU6QSV9_9FABA|nr:hypothetical protein [Stylosanthes scabra]